MARTPLDVTGEMDCADVLHSRFSALPGTATVAEVRRWFDESAHRKMAFLAEGEHYLGSLTRDDVGAHADGARPAAEVARRGPTVSPDVPASTGHEMAIATGALRVPVVDAEGRLLGVVAVTEDLKGFCG